MPIVDVQIVQTGATEQAPGLASTLADKLGEVFRAEPGRVWVRLSMLPSDNYAENGTSFSNLGHPVFVQVLHATLPVGEALESEAALICHTVASVVGRADDTVHVEYAAPGRGRVAFGGRLLG